MMKKIYEIWKNHALWFVFMMVVFGLGIGNLSTLYGSVRAQYMSKSFDTSVCENYYDNNFWNRLKFVDIQGEVAKIAGQKINNGVIKGDDGKLNLLDNLAYVFSEEIETEKVDRAAKILESAESCGAEVLYVQRPWSTGEVPYGYDFEYDEKYDFWCEQMQEKGFPILDLRKELGDKLYFFKTDHHWEIESSFYANAEIIHKLEETYDLNLDKDNIYTNIEEYDRTLYEESFLGSEGIRTGQYFAGKDDFEVITPRFETEFFYTQYKEHQPVWSAEGEWEEVFINKEKLEDPSYNNKYAVYTYEGYIENRIINHKAENDKKVLLIADSFGRPMVTYLSLSFLETRYLDPQEGRYTDSYVEYIKEYKPDVVILMYDGDFQQI